MTAINYISALDDSGYAQAAIAYVRGLVNAGADVHWQTFAWPDAHQRGPHLLTHEEALARAQRLGEAAQNDLVAQVRATKQPVNADARILHTIPEYFPLFAATDRKLSVIGMTAWETSKIPPHWVSLCNAVNRLVVPSTHNQRAFSEAHLAVPVHVVAHIRRSRWSEFSYLSLDPIRSATNLRNDVFTFYCISTADPRKNIRGLLKNFCAAFTADQPVQLLIKTSEMGHDDRAPFVYGSTARLIETWLREIAFKLGRPTPSVRVIASNRLSQRDIDALHELGDCYVSFARGEGWGLGAFDAATYGNPVLMPNWGGQLDFLPQPWRGAMPVSLRPSPIWPTQQPSMWNDQYWAEVSHADGIRALQDAFNHSEDYRENARHIQAFIANEFSEERVTKRLLDKVSGVRDV